jgi:7-cyano-7-deazaguanine synthase in queuosine biosynthesis
MPETIVRVATPGYRGAPEFHVRINGTDPSFFVDIDAAERRLVATLDPVLLDLLDIAASVFAADGTVSRGGDARLNFGAGWHRTLDFDIPVRCHELWSRADTTEAVRTLVEFLTGDAVSLRFRPGAHDALRTRYLDLVDAHGPTTSVEEVVLFSGGLDSLTGALEVLRTTDHRVALVTHLSAPKMTTRQLALAAKLKAEFGARVTHFPIRAHRKGHESRDTTQRSRSLIFLALGFLVARTLGAKRLTFFENGIVSVNLPIAAHVIGTMGTRTTHPRSLELMRRLIAVIGGGDIQLSNRYAWMTKTEVLQKLDSHGGSAWIEEAVSCTRVRDQEVHHTHCGECSQCLDRRFAVLAAGLQTREAADRYNIDVLTGGRESERSRTMANDWTLHADFLSRASFAEFTSRFSNEIVQVCYGHPADDASRVAARLFDLHRRHGISVGKALAAELSLQSVELLAGRLAPSSLVAMAAHARTMPPPFAPREFPSVVSALVPFADEDAEEFEIFPLKVWFGRRDGKFAVQIRHLATVQGTLASVPHALLPAHLEDKNNGLPAEKHRYFLARDIPLGGYKTEGAARAQVMRLRDKLNTAYRIVTDEAVPRDLLIESRHRGGYRLDPSIVIRQLYDSDGDPGLDL